MKALLATLSLFASLFLFTAIALAHGGRTDACGGHNDRKHGGYHVHNYGKYCACYPDACKKDDDKADDKEDSGKEEDGKGKEKDKP